MSMKQPPPFPLPSPNLGHHPTLQLSRKGLHHFQWPLSHANRTCLIVPQSYPTVWWPEALPGSLVTHHPFLYSSVHPTIHPFIHLFICPFIHPLFHLSIYLSIYPLALHPPICLSIHLFVWYQPKAYYVPFLYMEIGLHNIQ